MIRRSNSNSVHVNVAPLIDVLLVLIIILMITAYAFNNGIEVDLPKTETVSLAESKTDPIILTVDKNMNMYLGELAVTVKNLKNDINNAINAKKTNVVYIRCDKSLNYGYVMQLMSKIASTTTARVALISQQDDAAQIQQKESTQKRALK